ncbi:DUF423 domain-containing protein [Flammeovirgaceae bacterium SG7u.111]|nr:DUF423 domain-containing protein [Flammeovirgaceae bacterium SG7u.132]WPO36879.1 DUF423 domain-containing protein [Flammeovirgaceae bacterium SG7u.111]
MKKTTLSLGAIFSAFAVGIGAFGAHSLKPLLEATQRTETFETAVKYHFYHALGLLFIGILMLHFTSKLLNVAAYLMIAGILIFSGSLYLLCLTNIGILGAITPIGGLCFITAWLVIVRAVLKQPHL